MFYLKYFHKFKICENETQIIKFGNKLHMSMDALTFKGINLYN